jgi:hypothetical protein
MTNVARTPSRHDTIISVLLFAAILTGYLLSGNRAPFDSALYLHTSLSIVREGNTNLDEYPDILAQVWWPPDRVDGHQYDVAPIGIPVLSVPIVWLADRVWPLIGQGDFQQYLQHHYPVELQSIMAGILVALTAVLLYRLARLRLTWPYAVLLALMFAFGTTAWSVVSRTLWQHGPSMLLLTLALLFTLQAQDKPQRIQYVGLIVALAYVTRPTNSIAVVAYTLFVLLFYRKWLWKYLAWAAVVAIPFIAYSLTTYHSILPSYYQGFALLSGATFFEALIGHWVSPSRGFLIYSPILILAIIGIGLTIKRRQWQHVDGLLFGIIVAHWIVVSLWWNWWAGVSFGPRIWSDMLPYLAYFMIPTLVAFATLRGKRRWLAAVGGVVLIGWSVFVHYRGANAGEPMDWNGQPAPIDAFPRRVWDWRDPQWLRGVTFGPPVNLAVAGIPFAQVIDSDVRARLGTDNIQPRQFEASSSLMAPAGEAWFAIAENQPIVPELAALFEETGPPVEGHTLAEYPPYRLYHFNLADRVQQAAQQAEQTTPDVKLPIKFGDTVELMGYQLAPSVDGLTLITYWRAGEHIISPLKLFVHALGPDGAIVAQDDRLDVPAELWQTGDWIAQVNRVKVPADKHQVTVAIGLYNPATNTRLPINLNGQITDRLLLRPMDLK